MPGGKFLWVLTLIGSTALASVTDDLDAAIALYEAKKSEQAVKALRVVVSSSEATSPIRARAHLYLGLCLSKLGEQVGATAAFTDAFQLDPLQPIPFGTRADIAERAEVVRAETTARLEARSDIAEWSPSTGVVPAPPPSQSGPVGVAPNPGGDAANLPAPLLAAPDPMLVAPPLPSAAPTSGPPPRPPNVVAKEVKETNRDDGLHVGAGMRFIYNPVDEVLGPAAEFTFGSQKEGRRLAALVTLFPGRQWGVGGALRILFGPVIKRWRIEFGFDLGAIVYPGRLQVAIEATTRVLGFSFPAGPVRVNVQLLTAGLYANFMSQPIAFIPALGAGFGVEY